MLKYIFTLFICSPFVSFSQTRWSFELHGGVIHNLRLPLVIHQNGYPDIRINKAHFHSEPLNDPFYWDWRFTKWVKKKSIEFEAIHHKLYLVNKPAEVDQFQITHGYNMLMLNHGRVAGKFIVRAGLGSVLLHVENTIRGMEYPVGPGFDWKGYRLSGILLNIGFAKQFKLSKTFFINTEVKMNASVVNAPVVNGYARVHIVVFQLILGPGFNWSVRE